MIEIITASLEEIPFIQSIARKTWPVTFSNILSPPQIEYMLEMMYSSDVLKEQMINGHEFKLFMEDQVPLGFIGMEHDYKGSSKTKIHKIYILPEAQGKGIGKALMMEAMEDAKNKKSAALFLNVNRQNKAAIEFYHHLGMEIILSEDIDIGNGYLMEDYVMLLNLQY